MQQGLGVGAADARQLHDKAYFLDLLGDSHHGLGRHEEAIEAYRQAAQGFREQGAQCSYALCLLKIADSYLSLDEPWHALGYLEACLPLLQELGLRRHETDAHQQLVRCRAGLAEVRLRWGGAGRPEFWRTAAVPPGRFWPGRRERPVQGRFVGCPGQADRRTGSATMSSRRGARPST